MLAMANGGDCDYTSRRLAPARSALFENPASRDRTARMSACRRLVVLVELIPEPHCETAKTSRTLLRRYQTITPVAAPPDSTCTWRLPVSRVARRSLPRGCSRFHPVAPSARSSGIVSATAERFHRRILFRRLRHACNEVRPLSGPQFLLCPSEVNGQIVRLPGAG